MLISLQIYQEGDWDVTTDHCQDLDETCISPGSCVCHRETQDVTREVQELSEVFWLMWLSTCPCCITTVTEAGLPTPWNTTEQYSVGDMADPWLSQRPWGVDKEKATSVPLPRGRLVKVQSEVGVKASKKLNFQLRGTQLFPHQRDWNY